MLSYPVPACRVAHAVHLMVCLQGQMCAALLGWPQATFASELVLENEQLRVRREVDEGQQEVTVRLPAVVTTDLRLNTPRCVHRLNSCAPSKLLLLSLCNVANIKELCWVQICFIQGCDSREEESD
jgi:Electron transfer flavoprotein domain